MREAQDVHAQPHPFELHDMTASIRPHSCLNIPYCPLRLTHVCTLQIQSAAASAIRELLLLQPLLSLSILPFILLQLRLASQRYPSTYLSGALHSPDHNCLVENGDSQSTDSAKTQVCLLRLLLPMAADASVAPFALRVIQQLLQEDSPVLVRCLGLRLLADVWLTHGRFESTLPSLRDCAKRAS